ncbi:hypothetical protein TNCV_4988401 [Trichonephila clavipes]|nr:hypothetical protein TNCV_4988401 [Trichonephila clavipes]
MVFTTIVSLLVVSKTAKILGIPTDIDDDVHDFAVEDYSSKEEMELTLQPTTTDPLFEYSDNSTDQVLSSKVWNISSTSPLPPDEKDASAEIQRLVPFIFMSAISVGIMVLLNSTDIFKGVIVDSMGTTSHHRTWGGKRRLEGENYENSSHREDEKADQKKDQATEGGIYTYTARMPQWRKVPCFPTTHPSGSTRHCAPRCAIYVR